MNNGRWQHFLCPNPNERCCLSHQHSCMDYGGMCVKVRPFQLRWKDNPFEHIYDHSQSGTCPIYFTQHISIPNTCPQGSVCCVRRTRTEEAAVKEIYDGNEAQDCARVGGFCMLPTVRTRNCLS